MTRTPPLALVQRFHKDGKPVLRRRLSAPESEALRQTFTDEGEPTESRTATAVTILEECSRGGLWIACGCHGGQPWPVMYPQHTQSRSLMLVRNYERPEHAPGCPFSRLRKPRQASMQSASPQATDFIVLHATREGVAKSKVDDASSRASGSKVPKLARILFRLLHEAGLDVIAADGLPPAREAWRSLSTAVAGHTLDAGGLIPLGDVIRFGLQRMPALAASLREHASAWPHNLPAQGYLIAVAHSIDGATITGRPQGDNALATLTTRGAVTRFGEAATSGPWLSISLVGCEPGGHWFVPLRTYLHPLYRSWSLVPVDSDAERQTLDALLGFQKWLPCTITKPLPGFGAEGDTVRPDFVIRDDKRRTVCVETMGYEKASYLEAKARTHPEMAAHYGPVVCHAPARDDAHALRRALTLALLH